MISNSTICYYQQTPNLRQYPGKVAYRVLFRFLRMKNKDNMQVSYRTKRFIVLCTKACKTVFFLGQKNPLQILKHNPLKHISSYSDVETWVSTGCTCS